MFKRIVTGFFILLLMVGGFLLRQFVDTRLFNIIFYAFCLFGSFEMLRATKDKTTFFQKAIVIAYALALTPIFTFFSLNAVIVLTFSAILLVILSFVFDFNNATIEGVGITLLCLIYPNVLVIPMLITNTFKDVGFVALLLTFSLSSFSDVFAYFIGTFLRGPKLTHISPNKTISGCVGGLVGGMLCGFLVWLIFGQGLILDNLTVECIIYIVIGLLSSATTQLGDLVEGAIKRKLDIKDMGCLFPGHGGMLDRIDGEMITGILICFIFSILNV